jgi:hydrogenase expression/formation protein HypE
MSETIILDHGSGGKISNRLVSDIMLPAFDNDILAQLNDGAVVTVDGLDLAFSTDTFVVDPIFFPGGNIGDLAVNGTVNDIAMCGATPLFLSTGLIIEEGFPIDDLKTIIKTMGDAARNAGVMIVTGDTKVVPRGAADKIFINTSGVGRVKPGTTIGSNQARPGDRIILSGTIADHGMTILTQREGLAFDAPIESDSAPLNGLVADILETSSEVRALRDPTRGGLGTTLNEIAINSGVGITIYEDRIPVRKEVAGVCELLGFDPLYVANEGKLVAFVGEADTDAVLAAMRAHPHGKQALVIGEVIAESSGRVVMETIIGGKRIIDMLAGEQLPRIC